MKNKKYSFFKQNIDLFNAIIDFSKKTKVEVYFDIKEDVLTIDIVLDRYNMVYKHKIEFDFDDYNDESICDHLTKYLSNIGKVIDSINNV